MPDTAEPTATERLIDDAFRKRAQIAEQLLQLAGLEKQIIALGKGKHSGAVPGHVVTVVAAVDGSTGPVSYAFPAEVDAEEKARKLAGDKFGILFNRVVTFEPIEGFANVVPTHLTPAKARDLVKLCEVAGKVNKGKAAYILWPKG